MDRLISFPWSCKGKYGFLMEYIQVYGVQETLKYISTDNSIPTTLSHVIENIHNQKLANYVSLIVKKPNLTDVNNHSAANSDFNQATQIINRPSVS